MANTDFLEIERKFLIKDLPNNYKEFDSVKISQTYLSRPGVPPVLRVRQYGEQYLLTVKKRDEENPMICGEVEITIEKTEYEALKTMGEGRVIEKTRYYIPWEGLTVELDIFEEQLSGLILAEIEFPSKEQADRTSPPDWFGEEVTGNIQYSNNNLAQKGLPRK
ncbi:MAG: CYTH domain-containing protein [Spirochaetales bacterium]|nr:CYTH domain-containing protein [Spirochaetales bacterium]